MATSWRPAAAILVVLACHHLSSFPRWPGFGPTRLSSSTPQHLLYASPAWSGVVHLMPRRPTAAHRRFVGGGPGAAGPLGTATPHALPRHAPAPPPARRAVARNAGECAGVYCLRQAGSWFARARARGLCWAPGRAPTAGSADVLSLCISTVCSGYTIHARRCAFARMRADASENQ